MPKATTFIYALAFLAVPAISHAQATTTTPAQRTESKEERKEARKEKHPEIRAAIRALEHSKSDLQKAASDYGGHKVEAIKSIDEALKHLRLALDYDKK